MGNNQSKFLFKDRTDFIGYYNIYTGLELELEPDYSDDSNYDTNIEMSFSETDSYDDEYSFDSDISSLTSDYSYRRNRYFQEHYYDFYDSQS
tara:strand:+ start:4230 stop:4505 length:276 start_codon:yes stop_codon:yes gene_type:complete